jgi:hypothetical protein
MDNPILSGDGQPGHAEVNMALRSWWLLLLVGCTTTEEVAETQVQPGVVIDFEEGFDAEGVDLTDHTTDGGIWQYAEVSAFGEGGGSVHLTAANELGMSEAGFAVVGLHPVDLVAPAVFSVDIAFPGRPYNAPQRIEATLTGASAVENVDFVLDDHVEVWLESGMDDFVPAAADWFTLEIPLDPETLGDEVQITLMIVEDFGGLRPDVYVDNLAFGPR